MSVIRDPLDDLRKLRSKEKRLDWLNEFFGPRLIDKDALDYRAKMATRIREAKLWPK